MFGACIAEDVGEIETGGCIEGIGSVPHGERDVLGAMVLSVRKSECQICIAASSVRAKVFQNTAPKGNLHILGLHLGCKGQCQKSRETANGVHGEHGGRMTAWKDGSGDDEATLETASRAQDLYRTNIQRQSVDVLQGHVGQVQANGTVFDPHHRA